MMKLVKKNSYFIWYIYVFIIVFTCNFIDLISVMVWGNLLLRNKGTKLNKISYTEMFVRLAHSVSLRVQYVTMRITSVSSWLIVPRVRASLRKLTKYQVQWLQSSSWTYFDNISWSTRTPASESSPGILFRRDGTPKRYRFGGEVGLSELPCQEFRK